MSNSKKQESALGKFRIKVKTALLTAFIDVIVFFFNNKHWWQLMLKWLILIAVPYANLMLCGLIFDRWFKWYTGTVYIFIWVCLIAAIALIIGIWATVRYIKRLIILRR